MQRKWLFTKMFVWISRVSFILLFFCACRQPWRGGKTPAHMGNQITVLLLESSQPNKVKTQPVQLTFSSLNSDINRCSISWSGNCRKALMRMFSGQINSTTDGVSSVSTSFVSTRVSMDYLITSLFADPPSHCRTPAGLLIVFWVVKSTTGREMSLPWWLTVAGRSSTVGSGVKVRRVSPRRHLFLTLHLCLTLIMLCSLSLVISPCFLCYLFLTFV